MQGWIELGGNQAKTGEAIDKILAGSTTVAETSICNID
jgi:hypothetical protein